MNIEARGVYKITHRASGKAYIGKASNIAHRWAGHIKEALGGRGYAIHKAIAKHGRDAFDFEVIEVCDSDESALAAEGFWVEWYDTMAPSGYNLTTGGDGAALSEETKEKISAAKRGIPKTMEHRAKISAALTGVKLPEDRVERMRARSTGRKHTEASKAKMRGRHVSEETIEKLRACHLGRKRSPESVERNRKSHIGIRHSDEARAKISAAMKSLRARQRAEREASK